MTQKLVQVRIPKRPTPPYEHGPPVVELEHDGSERQRITNTLPSRPLNEINSRKRLRLSDENAAVPEKRQELPSMLYSRPTISDSMLSDMKLTLASLSRFSSLQPLQGSEQRYIQAAQQFADQVSASCNFSSYQYDPRLPVRTANPPSTSPNINPTNVPMHRKPLATKKHSQLPNRTTTKPSHRQPQPHKLHKSRPSNHRPTAPRHHSRSENQQPHHVGPTYDPLTIAHDILRAVGEHPFLAPLNGHLPGYAEKIAEHRRKHPPPKRERRVRSSLGSGVVVGGVGGRGMGEAGLEGAAGHSSGPVAEVGGGEVCGYGSCCQGGGV